MKRIVLFAWMLAMFSITASGCSWAATTPPMPLPVIPYEEVNWAVPPLRTFYASPAGTGTGTTRGSAKSLTTLHPMLRAGDRVILIPGKYPNVELSVRGTAARPIVIEAETSAVAADSFKIAMSNKTRFKNSGLVINRSSYLHVRGISFEVEPGHASDGITAKESDHLAFSNNYFFEQTNSGLLISGTASRQAANVLVEHNVFRNFTVDGEAGGIGGVRMDYGLRVHRTDVLVARGNLFDGNFNHSISLKEKVHRVLIEKNSLRVCGLVCIEGGQEPDTAYDDRVFDRTVSEVMVTGNIFAGTNDGTVGVFARNIDRAFIVGNQFNGISEPLRVANNDRNTKSCERQLYLVGRSLSGCEPASMLTQIGIPSTRILFERNKIYGNAKFILAGRGYPADFLSVQNSVNTGTVEICIRPFILNGADFNSWTEASPITLASPKLYRDASPGFVLKNGNCTGKDLTHACEADRSCTGFND